MAVKSVAPKKGNTAGNSACALSFGGQHLGLFFGHGPSLPSSCLVTKTNIRAWVGGSLLIMAAGTILIGGILIVAYGLHDTKAGQAAMKSAKRAGAVAAFGAAAA